MRRWKPSPLGLDPRNPKRKFSTGSNQFLDSGNLNMKDLAVDRGIKGHSPRALTREKHTGNPEASVPFAGYSAIIDQLLQSLNRVIFSMFAVFNHAEANHIKRFG